MKFLFLIHFVTFLAFVSTIQAQLSGVIDGPLNPENQETLIELQEKAQSEGEGGIGIALIEPGTCEPFVSSPPNAQVVSSASRTIGGCKTNTCDNGCCRLHTAFLTCDTKNTFKQLDCICNERTDNSHLTTGDDVGGTSGGESSSTTENNPVYPSAGTTTGRTSCMNGSPYQNLNQPFTNCAAGIDCAGITLSDGITPTCCKR
jgi:hypothetical protein